MPIPSSPVACRAPVTFMTHCVSSWSDASIHDLYNVRVSYAFDSWLSYTSKAFKPSFSDNVDLGGELAASTTVTLGAGAVGARSTGVLASSCVASFGAGMRYPCTVVNVGDPGTTGWCALFERFHRATSNYCISDPVNPINGAYSSTGTDAAFPSTGYPLVLQRSYDSTDKTASTLGKGWTSNLDVRLYAGDQIGSHLPEGVRILRHLQPGYSQVFITDGPLPSPDDPSILNLTRTPPVEDDLSPAQSIPPGAEVVLRGEGGGRYAFTPRADGTYASPAGSTDALVRTADGFSLTRADRVTYRFDDKGHLLELQDRNGRGLEFTWSSGHIVHAQDVAGHSFDLSYTNKLLTRVDLSDGRSVSYGYTGGRLTSVLDTRGKTTTYSYTPEGWLDTITDPAGNTIVDNAFDARGRITDQLDARGIGGHFDYTATETTYTDAGGGIWHYVLAGSLISQIIDPLGGARTFTHDARMDVVKLLDNGQETIFNYDSRHNLVDVLGQEGFTTHSTYTGDNQLATFTDPLGHVTSYDYDASGNLVSITPPAGPPSTFDYTGGLLSSSTDANGDVTRFHRNAAGEITSVVSPTGNETTFAFDASGRLSSMVDPAGNVEGADPGEHRWRFSYNEADQLISSTDPLGNETSSTFDDAGRISTATDANGHVTGYSHDAAGHLASITPPGLPATTFSYGPTGKLASRSDARGNVTAFTYDGAGRIATMSLANGSRWSYFHDPAGNLTRMVDANGNATPSLPNDGITDYTRDSLGRVTGINYLDVDTPDVSFTLDASGKPTSMSDGGGVQDYVYNELGRLTSVTRGSQVIGYEYDPAGNVTARHYPDGTDVAYDYNADGQLKKVSSGAQDTTYRYVAGRLAHTTLPNGVTADLSYDAAGRVAEVANSGPAGAISDYVYSRDPVGNPVSVTGSEQLAYRYDSADRLIKACYGTPDCESAADWTAWTYDGAGNRLTQEDPSGVIDYYYAADADELQGYESDDVPTTDLRYDANGNMTFIGPQNPTTQIAYDSAGNRIAEYRVGSARAIAQYSYDGLGNRLLAQHHFGGGQGPGGHPRDWEVSYLWDPNFGLPQLIQEREDGQAARSYTYGNSRISMDTPAGSYFYSADAMGSVRQLTDASGSVVASYGYTPFGEDRDSFTTPGTPENPMRFAGEYLDEAASQGQRDLYNLRAREYDAGTGRFLQRDPMGLGASTCNSKSAVNPYAYVSNRPTTMVDPSGMVEESSASDEFLIWYGAGLEFGARLAVPTAHLPTPNYDAGIDDACQGIVTNVAHVGTAALVAGTLAAHAAHGVLTTAAVTTGSVAAGLLAVGMGAVAVAGAGLSGFALMSGIQCTFRR